MSIPFLRDKAYCDDGVTEYQCLNCYVTWRAQTYPANWKMCPVCGCRWSGHIPQKREKYYDQPYARSARIICCSFRIEERFIPYTNGKPETPLEWKHVRTLNKETAVYAYSTLKDYRQREEDSQAEQREENNGQLYMGTMEYRVVKERSSR